MNSEERRRASAAVTFHCGVVILAKATTFRPHQVCVWMREQPLISWSSVEDICFFFPIWKWSLQHKDEFVCFSLCLFEVCLSILSVFHLLSWRCSLLRGQMNAKHLEDTQGWQRLFLNFFFLMTYFKARVSSQDGNTTIKTTTSEL